ncbi:hypothetical protein EZS27_019017 [termite gut metagenome]|uniref:Uncharacterized protein n=1 Tax=termite gut metagenome TaxID=433724 RepID=A0A5J4REJ6_9ZZZZ
MVSKCTTGLLYSLQYLYASLFSVSFACIMLQLRGKLKMKSGKLPLHPNVFFLFINALRVKEIYYFCPYQTEIKTFL